MTEKTKNILFIVKVSRDCINFILFLETSQPIFGFTAETLCKQSRFSQQVFQNYFKTLMLDLISQDEKNIIGFVQKHDVGV